MTEADVRIAALSAQLDREAQELETKRTILGLPQALSGLGIAPIHIDAAGYMASASLTFEVDRITGVPPLLALLPCLLVRQCGTATFITVEAFDDRDAPGAVTTAVSSLTVRVSPY